MEKSSHFGSPQVVAENVTTNSSDQGAGPGNIQFDIAALYLPYAQDLPENAERSRAAESRALLPKRQQATAAKPVEAHYRPKRRRQTLMATIREVRKTLMPVVIGLSVLIVACIVYMLSPAGRSRQTRENEYQLLQTQVLATRKDVLPTRGMDGKLKQASTDIGGFYAQRFPAHYSVVAEELGKLATQTGVKSCGAEV